jgi:glyoxylase-like metal-dependent hydrolase (beta-lactamase superfamily II)/rhodanese-related sulfurtransferase
MLIQSFYADALAHISYLLIGSKSAAVIDPKRDVDDYIEEAKRQGVKITHIFITHSHADFISGHLDLAKKTGAKIYAPLKSNFQFEHNPLAEGDVIEIDHIKLEVLETPGHTPDHVSYVITDLSRGEQPVAVFTGDTLFVGDVGRPDLFPNLKEELANSLYHSLFDKLLKLPDFVEIYPAHGAGTLCGKALAAKRTSTIGYEKLYNRALQVKDKNEFVEKLLEGMPAAPDHFRRSSAVNAKGPELVENLPVPKPMTPEQFEKEIQKGAIVVDVRSYIAWAGGHIPNSYSLDHNCMPFSTFAGWILPDDKNVLLVADTEEDVKVATIKLRRVGIDYEIGFLEGGMQAWAKAGKPVNSYKLISPETLEKEIENNEDIKILDVRSKGEWDSGYIEGSLHIPAPELRNNFEKVPKDKTIVLVCGLGPRAAMAASILEQQGFEKLEILSGGMTAWNSYHNKESACSSTK